MDSTAGNEKDLKPTILIVEDHEGVRTRLRKWLSAIFQECRFLEAKSGEEAVALASAQRPHIVLMDIGLPQMSGSEATRRIKAIVPQAHVVMLAFHEDADYRASAIKAGASAYVPKGKMHSQLAPVIAGLLSQGADTVRDQHPQERVGEHKISKR